MDSNHDNTTSTTRKTTSPNLAGTTTAAVESPPKRAMSIEFQHQHSSCDAPDNHTEHVWFYEKERTKEYNHHDNNHKKSYFVLSKDGVTQIAYHKYVPGTYTYLDTILNPMWTYLTELLPKSIAPNMITTMGGIHCFIAYIITWMYGTTNFYETDILPNWIFIMNGYCMIAYYTLDCMDGKQARRINASSPLGQLFDHGMDCLCLQQHLSMTMACVLPCTSSSNHWYLCAQAALQISFFVAQWEEYYTGSLPHSTGNIGVTEVNYGVAFFTLCNAFLNRRTIYTTTLHTFVPTFIGNAIPSSFLDFLEQYQVKHFMIMLWCIFILVLISLSLHRVVAYHIGHHRYKQLTVQVQASAVLKLVSPILIGIGCPLFLLPSLPNETRYISMSIGFAMTVITNKLIVYSMAKQTYACIQYKDCIVIVLIFSWIRYDTNITPDGIHLLLQFLTIYYIGRILYWTRTVTKQLCERLDVNLFTIKKKKVV